MTVSYSQFQGDVVLTTKIHSAYPNIVTELQAIVTALGSDATTHDRTIETPAAALLIGPAQSRFTNDILLLVNAAKGGNLSPASMAAAIGDFEGFTEKPGLLDIPYASASASPPIVGTVASCTQGNWGGMPTSYAYQWLRDGTAIGGATSATYTLVSADVGGHQLTCVVTATNAQGSTAAPPSNAIHVP